MLVLEKVGSALWRKSGELYVGGTKLSAENVKLLKEKILEALAVLHEKDVLHGDLSVRNLRLEMKDGRVSRVWKQVVLDRALNVLYNIGNGFTGGYNELYRRKRKKYCR